MHAGWNALAKRAGDPLAFLWWAGALGTLLYLPGGLYVLWDRGFRAAALPFVIATCSFTPCTSSRSAARTVSATSPSSTPSPAAAGVAPAPIVRAAPPRRVRRPASARSASRSVIAGIFSLHWRRPAASGLRARHRLGPRDGPRPSPPIPWSTRPASRACTRCPTSGSSSPAPASVLPPAVRSAAAACSGTKWARQLADDRGGRRDEPRRLSPRALRLPALEGRLRGGRVARSPSCSPRPSGSLSWNGKGDLVAALPAPPSWRPASPRLALAADAVALEPLEAQGRGRRPAVIGRNVVRPGRSGCLAWRHRSQRGRRRRRGSARAARPLRRETQRDVGRQEPADAGSPRNARMRMLAGRSAAAASIPRWRIVFRHAARRRRRAPPPRARLGPDRERGRHGTPARAPPRRTGRRRGRTCPGRSRR